MKADIDRSLLGWDMITPSSTKNVMAMNFVEFLLIAIGFSFMLEDKARLRHWRPLHYTCSF